ncbi:MAG: protein kinase [Deltaproteobacteria bacterium]|nr:protein kinase [Deltaproteobacteria bacterium]
MPAEPQPGQMIGANVQLVSPLGEGGMGKVWVADHLTLRTKVVVKFMSEELAATAEGRSRFSREAAAAARVRSPHVVQTLDHGVTDAGVPYIVLELLEGHDLGRYIEARKTIPPEELLLILAQLARALARVHECGVIHRDIKPSNIFLCDAGGGEVFVKLLDFGIAKSSRPDDIGAPLGGATNTGSLVGTPYYMSPEQLAGSKEVDHRSDLWSVGIVAFEALTGVKPFDAASLASLAVMVLRDEIPRPSSRNPALPPTIDDWFIKSCARDPAARFPNIREMVEAFAHALGEVAPSVPSVPRVVSVPPKAIANAETNPLGSSVSPNAMTLHDTARSGAPTQPGARPAAAQPGPGRIIGWGATMIVVGAILAFGVIKLSGRGDAQSPSQGLAASGGTSLSAVPAAESVPLVATAPSVAVAPTAPASVAATPSASAGTPPVKSREAGTATTTSTPPAATAATSARTPPPTATATKPPVPKPGNEDDIK